MILLYIGEVSAFVRNNTETRRDTTNKRGEAQRHIFKLDSIGDKIHLDTIKLSYIKIDTAKGLNHISNLLAKNLFSSSTAATQDTSLAKVKKFAPYVGKTIDSIVIVRNNVFKDKPIVKGNDFANNTAKALTSRTRERTIKRYLLFKKGDAVVSEDIIKSEALLRDMRSISSANIELDTLDNGKVVAHVETNDSWNIYPAFIYRYTDNGYLQISDVNFMGTGNRLDLNQYYNARQQDWFKGLEMRYTMPNLFGSFFDLSIGGGYGGKEFNSLFIEGNRYFVSPNDWAGGLLVSRRNEEKYIGGEGMFTPVDRFESRMWFGQSINISPRWGDNFYYTLKFEERKHYNRPYVSPTYSPYYHNGRDYLFSLGFYKEKFYRGNMIYSYGVTESIPYGYKAEIMAGYREGEFDNAPYIGTRLSIGNIISLGYIAASVNAGKFLHNKESLQNSIVDVNLLYFTHLINLSRDRYFRQFININYTSAIDILRGAYTEFQFKGNTKLRNATYNGRGTTRININPESVFFTQYHIGGFRFAYFGYADVGTLGYSDNPFKNPLYAVVGAGVRVRNEALIFKTIEFKVMIAVKGHPEFRNNLFYIGSDTPLGAPRYLPKEPQIINF